MSALGRTHRVEPLRNAAMYVTAALTGGKAVPKTSNRRLFAAKISEIVSLQVAKFLFRVQNDRLEKRLDVAAPNTVSGRAISI